MTPLQYDIVTQSDYLWCMSKCENGMDMCCYTQSKMLEIVHGLGVYVWIIPFANVKSFEENKSSFVISMETSY